MEEDGVAVADVAVGVPPEWACPTGRREGVVGPKPGVGGLEAAAPLKVGWCRR